MGSRVRLHRRHLNERYKMQNKPHPDLMKLAAEGFRNAIETGDLTVFLRRLVRGIDAFGVIVWELVHRPPSSPADEDRLYMASSWFRSSKQFTMHDLPVKEGSEYTVTGRAITSGKYASTADVQADGGPRSDHPFLIKSDVGPLVSIPIRFTDGNSGTVDLMRKRAHGEFSEKEIAILHNFAVVIPALYQAVRDRVSWRVVADIDSHLRDPALVTADKRLEFDAVLQSVAGAFNALEVSLFLTHPRENPGEYMLQGSTWPRARFRRTSYCASDIGKTPAVIRHSAPLNILDLYRTEPGSVMVDDQPVQWEPDRKFERLVRKELSIHEDAPPDMVPPMSYMAAPVVVGKQVFGAIRCCTTRNAPHYFTRRDVDLLSVVGAQLGRRWASWIEEGETNRKLATLQMATAGLGEVNGTVQEWLAVPGFESPEVFNAVLKVVMAAIPHTYSASIRLYDPRSRSLRFAATTGSGWNAVETQKAQFHVEQDEEGAYESIGARVYETGTRHYSRDLSDNSLRSGFIPDAKSTVVTPIKVGEKVYGVLDLIGRSVNAFNEEEVEVATLASSQVGLYMALAQTRVSHTRNYEALAHQLQNPINAAKRRSLALAKLLENQSADDQKRAFAIRGLCRKAARVTETLKFMSELEVSNNLKVSVGVIHRDAVRKLLLEAAQDNELVMSDRKQASGVMIDIPTSDFHQKFPRRIHSNIKFVEQVVNALFENAVKYGYDGHPILVTGDTVVRRGKEGGSREKRYGSIEVSSCGISLGAEGKAKCTERGWRSDDATELTDSGSGIGLWLVSKMMTACNGMLEVVPTQKGWTRFRLLFPE